jgi:hypothetical protein
MKSFYLEAPALEELEVFVTKVCPDGYQLLERGTDPDRFLTLVPLSTVTKSFVPPPDLFLTLADLEPTPEAILRFANHFGLLRGDISAIDRGVPLDIVANWQGVIREINAALILYVALMQYAEKKPELLEASIGWGADGELIAQPKFSIHPRALSKVSARFTRGDIVGPARFLLQQTINRCLHDSNIDVALIQKPMDDRLTLHIVPTNLQGCAWLQFAQLVSGGRSYRRCRNCSKWMLVSRKQAGGRPDRQTCSSACRMQIYLKRQAEAVGLAQQGNTVAEIASKLQTEPKTIRGWLHTKGLNSLRPKTRSTEGRKIK